MTIDKARWVSEGKRHPSFTHRALFTSDRGYPAKDDVMDTPPPSESDAPPPLVPAEGQNGNGSWFRLDRSSSQFGQRRAKSDSRSGSKPWPAPAGYEILGELGYGDMGVVFKARQIGFEQTFALKMILDAALVTPDRLSRFRREAEALAKLQHPNIVKIYEVGEHLGRPFLVLEYLDAGSLRRFLARTPPSPHQAAALLEPLARAVQHAHDNGIIHRDLKPSNILLGGAGPKPSGSSPELAESQPSPASGLVPKISDFGLAREFQTSDPQTHGIAVGTPQYMSPEQSLGQPGQIGPATDIYALGAILYEMLTGRPPFQGASTPETLLLLRTLDPVPPRRLRPRIPKGLETICLKCLEKAPARRYARAADLADDLHGFLNDGPIRARPIGVVERALRWRRRNPWLAIFVGLTAMLLLVLAVAGPVAAVHFSALSHRAQSDRDLGNAKLKQMDGERQEPLRALADVSATAGILASDETDPSQALLWFAHAARMAHEVGDSERELANRIRFRNWERFLCKSVHAFYALPSNEGPPLGWEFHASGRWLLVTGRERVRLWDVDAESELRLADSAIRCACWNPAGNLLAIGTDKGVRVQQFPSGESARHIDSPGTISVLAFDRTGKRLAIANRAVQVYDVERREFAGPPLPHPLPVEAMTFSPGGEYLATGGSDGIARVFDLNENNPVPLIKVPWRARSSASPLLSPPQFADGGRALVSLHPNQRQLIVWDVRTRVERYSIPAGTNAAYPKFATVCVSPDGHFLAAGTTNGVVVIDVATGKTLPQHDFIEEGTRTLSVAFMPDNLHILSAGADSSIRMWSRTGLRLQHSLPHHRVALGVAPVESRHHLAALLDDGTVRVWSMPEASSTVKRLSLTAPTAHTIVASLDGRHFITAGLPTPNDAPSTTRVYDSESGEPAGPILNAGGAILHGALAPHQPLAALAVNSAPVPERLQTLFAPAPGTAVVQLWNWKTGKLAGSPFHMPSEPRAVAFSADGARLAAVCAGGQIALINTTTEKIEKTWPYPTPVQRLPESALASGNVAFSPDGSVVLTWGLDDTLRAWDTVTASERFRFHQADGSYTGIAFSPDGGFLATTHERSPVTVWDWSKGIPVNGLTQPGQTERGLAVRFSPDGQMLLAALADGTAKLWDWRTGKLACPPLLHHGEVVTAEFLPGGPWLATASSDGRVRLWDGRDGRPISLGMMSPRCHSAALARNGKVLVIGCSDGVAVLYKLDDLVVPNDLPTSSDPESDRLSRYAQFLSGHEIRGNATLARLSPAEWRALAKRIRAERLQPGGSPNGP